MDFEPETSREQRARINPRPRRWTYATVLYLLAGLFVVWMVWQLFILLTMPGMNVPGMNMPGMNMSSPTPAKPGTPAAPPGGSSMPDMPGM